MASSHCVEKLRQGAKNLAWQAGHSSAHRNSPGLPLLCLDLPVHSCGEPGLAEGDVSVWAGRRLSRLPDAFPGFQPNLERSPANGAPVGACGQLFSSERCANVNASCLLKTGQIWGCRREQLSQTRQRKRGIMQKNS